jgi:hypothetical protein
MRNLITKATAGAMILAAGLLVAACGHSDNNAATDTNMTNMDTMDSSTGMSNDMSAVDATGNDANMATDNGAMADNSATAAPDSSASTNQM